MAKSMLRLLVSSMLLIGAAASIVVGQRFVIQNYLNANDDTLYTYQTPLCELQPTEMKEVNTAVIDAYKKLNASENLVFRYDLRHVYRYNYLVLRKTLEHYIQANHLAEGNLTDRSFRPLIARTFVQGYMAAGLVAACFLLLAIGLCADTRMYFAFALACALLLLLDGAVVSDLFGLLFGTPFSGGHTSLVKDPSFFTNLFFLIANPNYGFKAFTFLPPIGLLYLGVFALRWSGHVRLAYLFALGVAAFHQSMATLMFAWLVTLDLIQRPALFRDPRVLSMLAAAVALGLIRERIWFVIAVWHPAIVIAVAIVLIGAGAWIWRSGRSSELLGRLRSTWSSRPALLRPGDTMEERVKGDLVISAAIWTITLAYPYILRLLTDELMFDYFWVQVHGRLIGALRPALLTGAVLLFVLRYEKKKGQIPFPRRAIIGIGAIIVALIPVTYKIASGPDAAARIESHLVSIDQAIKPLAKLDGADEEIVYYAIAKQIATGEAVLRQLFPESAPHSP